MLARIAVVFFLATITTPWVGWARERPKVQVVFELAEPLWAQKVVSDGGNLEELNREVVGHLATSMGQRLGFIEFVTDPEPLQLKVSLVRQAIEPGTQFIPTDFVLEILGLPPEVGVPRLVIPFRHGFEYVEPITYAGLVVEARQRIETRLDTGSNLDNVVAKLLSHVSLADEVHVLQLGNVALAVIPWSGNEIHMANNSKFIIKTPIPGIGLPRDHYTRVVGPVSDELRNQLSEPYTRGLVVMDQAPGPGETATVSLRNITVANPSLPIHIIGLHVTFYIRSAPVEIMHSPSRFSDD